MMGYGYDGTGYGAMMGYGMVWMVIWSLVVIAGLVVLALAIAKLFRGGGDGRMHGSHQVAGPARLILDERYARGEIDEDDYRKRRTSLQ